MFLAGFVSGCRPGLVTRRSELEVCRRRLRVVCTAEDGLKVLVVGSGGREHALASKIASSPKCAKVFVAPGNVGMRDEAEVIPEVNAEDVEAIVRTAKEKKADLVVVGPEAALVKGVVDELERNSILAFGPTKSASILEGSKSFMKEFLERHKVPSAWYKRFTEVEPAKAFVREKGVPIVVKADGLAAGKGVILAHTVEEADRAVEDMLVKKVFGAAGDEIVIEEFLMGEEGSFFAVIDGDTALPLASAQDHKAAYDGDKGPNTGGMGAYSPAPICTPEMEKRIMDLVVLPTARGMVQEGRPYRGVLFCGMMFTSKGPKVLEFNVRFGDPECQVLCMRMKSDLLELLLSAAKGELGRFHSIEWDPVSAMVVVMATKGYPGSYSKGSVIEGVDKANALEGVKVYHAGTAEKDAKLVATGGRVLGVTARGKNIAEAQKLAYKAVESIHWPQGFYRSDIGWRALKRELANSP
mmetsp:Transcript_11325/g.34671  ORF Transcript_11325/g.34671 Transcript_11325/m.34671 type:complete len:469 (+) Transcript_11325:145-1551(+)